MRVHVCVPVCACVCVCAYVCVFQDNHYHTRSSPVDLTTPCVQVCTANNNLWPQHHPLGNLWSLQWVLTTWSEWHNTAFITRLLCLSLFSWLFLLCGTNSEMQLRKLIKIQEVWKFLAQKHRCSWRGTSGKISSGCLSYKWSWWSLSLYKTQKERKREGGCKHVLLCCSYIPNSPHHFCIHPSATGDENLRVPPVFVPSFHPMLNVVYRKHVRQRNGTPAQWNSLHVRLVTAASAQRKRMHHG